jgi:hypothetical protein
MNTEVVDLPILYNFYKGHLVFFSSDFSQKVCQLWMPLGVSEQEVLAVDQVFHLFPLEFEMLIYKKVVSLNKLDNFHNGRFWSA